MKKEYVYDLTEKVKLLIDTLDGIRINEDIYKVHQIEKIIKDLQYHLNKCSFTSYEEYSILTKKEYSKMIKLKKEYEQTKDEENKINIYDEYMKSAKKYEGYKKIRDIFKNS